MSKLPKSLSIAIWLAAAMWFVGILGYFSGASIELLAAIFVMGLVAAIHEWRMS